MKKITSGEVLNLWKNNKQSTGVYIHSPFCKEQCTYCTFKGTIFNKNSYKQYYQEYLPRMIDFYGDVLSSPQINGYFFGGGTPSLMSPDELRNLFDLIPNFKSQENKLMEMHVCDWSKEQLDVLREYNFNIVVVCVQTFDRDALKKYKRRVPKDIDVVCEHIQYANSIGLNTNSDLLYLDTGDMATDSGRLINDVQLLADCEITEITISTIFNEDGRYDNLVTAISEKFIETNPEYTTFSTYRGPIQGPQIGINYRATGETFPRCICYRMYRRDSDWREIFHWLPQLEEMPNKDYDKNTLGIGSYRNQKYTFSTIEDKLEYIEVGDLVSPEFFVMYDKVEYPVSKMITEFYNDLEELCGDCPDYVNITFSTNIGVHDPFDDSKQIYRNLLINFDTTGAQYNRIGLEASDKLLREYEAKLHEAWPILNKKWPGINAFDHTR